jgi:hypothetical protein
MNYFISMFIDNELGLREKIDFLKKIKKDDVFYEESVALLDQEQMLRSDMDVTAPAFQTAPAPQFEKKRKWFHLPDLPTIRPFAFFSSAGAMAVVIVLLLLSFHTSPIDAVSHRFVIYRPDVNTVDISGSFTDWEVLPMQKVGATGYWEIELTVPKGEHRYSFILEKEQRIADPTVFAREQDDFGGENSILFMSV